MSLISFKRVTDAASPIAKSLDFRRCSCAKQVCVRQFSSTQLAGSPSIAWVAGTSGSRVGTDSVKSIWFIPIVVMMGFVRILDLRKPSATIILGPTSSLLVAEVLTGSRCEEPCNLAVSLQKGLNRLCATDQHALHFQHSDASLMDCLGLEIYLRCQS